MDHSRLACGFSFLLLTVLAVGCGRQANEPHILGHVAPRSGPDQAAGLRAGDAVALAVDELNVNEALRIDGKTVSVIHGDTGPDTDGYGFQATRLLTVNRAVALLGGTNAAELEKLLPVIQTHQIVLVT